MPVRNMEAEELARRLPRLLERFDGEELAEAVRIAIDCGARPGLLAKALSVVERDPTNLPALYLTGSLMRHESSHQREALSRLHFGFDEGVRQGLPLEDLLAFYREAVLIDPAEAFAWLSRVGGPWDNDHGLFFLRQEAAARFGPHADGTRALTALWQVRELQLVADSCEAVVEGLRAVRDGITGLMTTEEEITERG
jgi:ATP-dependent DNA helicase RecQ